MVSGNASDFRQPAGYDLTFVDQRRTMPLSAVPDERAVISLLYAPSYESRTQDAEGQDYVVVRQDEQTVSFAVCDGVGQSFCGHLAAKFLGNALVEWLGSLEPFIDKGDLASRLTGFLTDLTAAGQQLVLDYPLPVGLSPLVQAALEGQRAYGSETMFVCGRLRFPEGGSGPSQSGQLILCWLGDAEVQLFDRAGASIDVGARWTSHERWSTSHGIRGTEAVHVWVADLSQIGQVVLYTDGLDSVKDDLRTLIEDPDRLHQEVERIYDSPASDDISLISIRLEVLPAPILFQIRNPWFLSDYDLHWSPVRGAGEYLVEESGDPHFGDGRSWVAAGTSYHVEGQPSGNYCYRVRAVARNAKSEPSNAEWVRTIGGMKLVRWVLPVLIMLAFLLLVLWSVAPPGQ